MRTFENKTVDGLWISALEACAVGRITAPRGLTTLEVNGLSCFELLKPEHSILRNPYRKLNYAFMFAEFFWMLGGHQDVKSISRFNKKIADFSDDGENFFGAYGPRIAAQLGHVVATLKADRDSRQAVITIWRPSPWKSKDIPCTVMMHFMVRDFSLELNVYMRSNDVWLGFPYDVFNFTSIQKYVCSATGYGLGTYRHIVGSLHLYAGDVYKIAWAKRHHTDLLPNFSLPYLDHVCADKIATRFEDLPPPELCTCSFSQMGLETMHAYLTKNPNMKNLTIKRLEEESKRVRSEIGDSPESSAPPTGD